MSEKVCDWYWGSHGCDKPLGHDGIHLCGDYEHPDDDPCSEFDAANDLVRHGLYEFDTDTESWVFDEWSDWQPCGYGFRMDDL